MELKLLPGDVFFTRGQSWLSRAIRWGSRQPGEMQTVANHVGVVVSRSGIVVEALSRVKEHHISHYAEQGGTEIAIYRHKGLALEQRRTIAEQARLEVGRRYGYTKIGLHLLDKLLGGGSFFRNLSFVKKWPICSYLVAQAYASVGYTFWGFQPEIVDPDNIWDHVTQSAEWEEVLPLTMAEEVWPSTPAQTPQH